MENIDHKEIFFNRAEVEEAENICCKNCFEQVVFLLRDKEHEFSMGMTTVLQCLEFAENEGEIPPLPSDWWIMVKQRFRNLSD